MLTFAKSRKHKSSLIDVWSEVFGEKILQLEDEDLNLLAKACVAYICNVIQWPAVFQMLKSINSKVEHIVKEPPFEKYKQLRHGLIRSTRTSLNVKLFLYRMLVQEMNGDNPDVRKEAKHCDVSPSDIIIWENLEIMGLKPMMETISGMKGFSVPLPKVVHAESAKFVVSCRSYIESYTRKSLRFLYTSNNLQDEDIMGELVLAATNCYYQKVLFLPKPHLENCVRKTIANYGRKLIDYYTDPCRSRLLQSRDGGFENRILVCDDLADVVTGRQYQQGSQISHLEATLSIDSLKKEYGKVISLLLMEDDADFIQANSSYHADSCEELFEKAGRKTYRRLIAKYLSLPVDYINTVVENMREQIAS